MLDAAYLPDDVAALKAMLIAAHAREACKDAQIARKNERIEWLEKLVAAFKQQPSGASPSRPIPTSSIWRWKTWKRPSQRSMPRKKQTPFQGIRSQEHARSIAAPFQSIFLGSKR